MTDLANRIEAYADATALHALTRKGRYWIERHRPRGFHVIDSSATLPISRLVGNFSTSRDAWEYIKKLRKFNV